MTDQVSYHYIREDGDIFRVTSLGHWSIIESDSGEADSVKWLGGDEYIGRSGAKYRREENP